MPRAKKKNNYKSTKQAAVVSSLVEIYVNLSSFQLYRLYLLGLELPNARLTQQIKELIEGSYNAANKAINSYLLPKFEAGEKALIQFFSQKVSLPSLSLLDDMQIQQGETTQEVLGARLIFQCLHIWITCNVESLLMRFSDSQDKKKIPLELKFFYSLLQIIAFHKRSILYGEIDLGMSGVSSLLSKDYVQFGRVVREQEEVILPDEMDIIDQQIKRIQGVMTPTLAFIQGSLMLPSCEINSLIADFVLHHADKTGKGKVLIQLDFRQYTEEMGKLKISELDERKLLLESKVNIPGENQLGLLIDFELLLKAAFNICRILKSLKSDARPLLIMQKKLVKSISSIVNKFLKPLEDCVERLLAVATQLFVKPDSLALVPEDEVNRTIVEEFFCKLSYHFTPSPQLALTHSENGGDRSGILAECWDVLSCYHVGHPLLADEFSECLPRLRYFRELLTCLENFGGECQMSSTEAEKAVLEDCLASYIKNGGLQGYSALQVLKGKLIELIERNQKDLGRVDPGRAVPKKSSIKKKTKSPLSQATFGSPDYLASNQDAMDGGLSKGLVDNRKSKKITFHLYSAEELRLHNMIDTALLFDVIPNAKDHFYESHVNQDLHELHWFRETVSLIFKLYVLTNDSCKSRKANARFDLYRLFVCMLRAYGSRESVQMVLSGWFKAESSQTDMNSDTESLCPIFFKTVDYCWRQEEQRSHSLLNEEQRSNGHETPSEWFRSSRTYA